MGYEFGILFCREVLVVVVVRSRLVFKALRIAYLLTDVSSYFFQQAECPVDTAFRNWIVGKFNDTCFGIFVQFESGIVGINALFKFC